MERTTLPASAAVPGGSVAGAPSTGGDPRSDLRTDPRGDPQGDLAGAADAALYQELRVWRAEVADVAGIPVFMILTNRRLRDIVRVRPASLAALGGGPASDADRPTVTEEPGSAPMSDPSSEIPSHA